MTRVYTNIDKSVIESCKRGNRIAQYTLYNQYSKAMFNLAYRMMNSREDAEDILQESFTEAFRKLKTYRYESTIGAWIKTIVINKSINQLRKRKVELFTDEFIERAEEDRDSEIDFTTDIAKVHKAIEKLPNGYRLVFTLYLLEGYDHKEVSEILNISESTSKSQYLRAKKRLKEILAEEEMTWTN